MFMLVQETGLPYSPATHCSTSLSEEHVDWPAAHAPAHDADTPASPSVHVESVHATGAPHAPVEVHDWTPLPVLAHCDCIGAHVP
jgi:hypothetical protein